jgi:hypothetical protein
VAAAGLAISHRRLGGLWRRLDQVGCEARKIPAVGGVFFLDFLAQELVRGNDGQLAFMPLAQLHRDVLLIVVPCLSANRHAAPSVSNRGS